MSVIDGVILCFLFMELLRGLMAGAIKTAFVFIGYLTALVMASKLAPQFAPLLQPITDNQLWQITLSFFGIALIIISIVHVAAHILTKTLKLLKLGALDKLGGMVLGLAKGLLKLLILLSLIAPILPYLPATSSALVPSLLPFAPVARQWADDAFEQTWQEVQNPYQSL